MIPLYLLDPDLPGPAWAPFDGVRPLAELRVGAWRIRERWSALLGAEAAGTLAPHVPAFVDIDALPVGPIRAIPGPAVIARSTFVPTPESPVTDAVRRLTHLGETVVWFVPEGTTWSGPEERAGEAREVPGLLLSGTWDLLAALEWLLADDCAHLAAAEAPGSVPDGSIVLGDPALLRWDGAEVEPGAILDLRRGAIVLEANVIVRAGTRLEGPLYVGRETWLLGGAIRNSSIGPHCRIHGEVSSSVFLGFANKSHDGFLGHSVLGHWVNLGAGTITSNLKNTYGPIRIDLPDIRLETGRSNLGSLIGDHAKTAIGTMLATGTVIGVGASVHGTVPVPRYVRPFAWGADGVATLERDGFIKMAGRVMPRRQVALTLEREGYLVDLHDRLAYPGPRLYA